MNRNQSRTDKSYPAVQLIGGSLHQQPVYRWMLLLLVMMIMVAIAPRSMAGQQTVGLDVTVQYLITYVQESDVIFERNSSRYSGEEAAQHINKKYKHYKDDIDTPEKFIKLCATGSLMTGKPYFIITPEGEQMPSNEWLQTELAVYRLRNEYGAP